MPLTQTLTYSIVTTTVLILGITLSILSTPVHAQTQGEVCNLYTPSVTTPTGYGASYNVFNQSELMLSIYCNEDKSVTVTAGNNDPLTYVYNQGYYYANNQWNNFTYTCTDETIADIWCTKQATKTLTSTPTSGTTYLVSYTCQWRNNTWNCGCHNSACTTNHWQLQGWTIASGGGGGTSGPHAAFANVPIPAGAMNFSWFEDVTASYGSSVQDDPVNWTTLYQQANRKIEVSSCGALKTAVSNARAGDIIVVANGTYNDCNVSFTKSGTQSNPIVITSEAKALGQSGGVTFRGANVFGTFSNQASHYIIGGFRFEDQGNIAFKLNDGAPNAVNSTNVRFTDSHFEGIGAKRGSNDAVIAVGMRNNNIRIDHNSFVSNYNHPRFESGDPADGVSKNGRIDHNYFGPAATSGFLNGVPYEIGAIQTCCGKANPNVNQLTLLVEYNVAEHKRSGNTGNTDGEVFEIKSNGATIRNNIIWGDDRSAVSLRQSHNSVIEGNYLVGTGIIISGAYHTIRNNEVRAISEMRQGIIMSRWGRRQPDNCTTLPETHDNTVENNTIVGTTDYGIRIGDCDYGACRPVYDSVFRNNTVQAISGQDIYLNTKNEPGRTTSCSNDRPGDTDGGVNTGIVIQ